MANTKISDLTQVVTSSVNDTDKILLAGADVQSGTPGTSVSVSINDISELTQTQLVTKTAHGLVVADEGKPIYNFAVVDDTIVDQKPQWLLVQVLDVNTVRVAPSGGVANFPVGVLTGGSSWDVDTDGNTAYWDESTGMYTSSAPAGTQLQPSIFIVSVSATEFTGFMIAQGSSSGGGGGGATNLSWDAASSTVQSDTGTNAQLSFANVTDPGLMTPAQLATLNSALQSGDVDLLAIYFTSSVVVSNTAGDGFTLNAATGSTAGAMVANDKSKLDLITVTQAIDLDSIGGGGGGATTKTITATGHGLSNPSDIGKPLAGLAKPDDTDETNLAEYILVDIVDANTLEVGPPGHFFNVANSGGIIEQAGSWDPSDGYLLWWDQSLDKWTYVEPGDTAHLPAAYVLQDNGSNIDCMFFPQGPKVSGGGGGTISNLGWNAGSGQVTNTGGDNAVLTIVDGTNPGLMSSAQLTTLNSALQTVDLTTDVSGALPILNIVGGAGAAVGTYLKQDGTWDTPAAGTTSNLGWSAASNQITNSGGDNVIIPVVNATNDGLMTSESLATLGTAVQDGDVTMSQFATDDQLFLSIISGGVTGGGLTLDSATTSFAGLMSATDKTTLDALGAAGADLDGPVELVEGSGSASTDTTNLTAAVAALNASATGGTLWIKGTVIVADGQVYNFTKPVNIKGVPGTDATLEYQGAATNGYFAWNNSFSGMTTARGGTAFSTAPEAGDSELFVPTGTIPAGSWFLMASDNNITGVCNQSGYKHSPIEMHQCKEVRDENTGGVDMIVFDDFLSDDYTDNGTFAVITPTDGVEVSGLKLNWTGPEGPGDGTSSGPNLAALQFKNCVNVIVKDLHWLHDGPNEAGFYYCANVLVTQCTWEAGRAYDNGDGYAVVIAPVNNFVLSDSIAYGWRHIFTTTAQNTGGSDPTRPNTRFGTTRNVIIDNVIAKGNGSDNAAQSVNSTTLVPFDTHECGYGIVFQNCHVANPYDRRNPGGTQNSNRGFQTRSRNTVFQNCVVESAAGSTNGFLILGTDAKILNCTVIGGWKAIEQETQGAITEGSYNNLLVKGFTFVPGTNSNCEMVRLEFGQDAVITGCSMVGTSSNPGGYGVRISGTSTTCTVSHCLFANLQHEAVEMNSTTSVARISHCDLDNVGSTGAMAAINYAADGFMQVFNCTIDAESNNFAFGGTSFNEINLKARGNTLTGYSAKSGTTSVNGIDNTNSNLASLDSDINGKNWTD